MKVSFVLGRANFFALRYALAQQNTNSAYRLARVISPALLGGFAQANFVLGIAHHIPQCFAAGLFLTVLLFIPFLSRELDWRKAARNRNFDLRTEVAIQNDGIHVRDYSGESLALWETVVFIRDTPRHIILLRTKERGIVVPKLAFASPDEAKQFLSLAESCW